MKFKLEMELKKPELPIEYRKSILSLIKNALTEANDGKYFERFFHGADAKDYTFAVNLPKATFRRPVIELGENKIYITFSTFDKMTGYILFAVFSERVNKRFPLCNDNSMMIKRIQMLNEKEVLGTEMLVKFMAPLAVRKHEREGNKDLYFVYSDEQFRNEYLNVLKNQLLSAGFVESQIENLNVVPINMKKVIITHYGCSIPCSLGFMLVQGNQSVLNYLLKSGVGSRRSSGFGMVELVAQQEVK